MGLQPMCFIPGTMQELRKEREMKSCAKQHDCKISCVHCVVDKHTCVQQFKFTIIYLHARVVLLLGHGITDFQRLLSQAFEAIHVCQCIFVLVLRVKSHKGKAFALPIRVIND